ncbi:YycH family regulatory protein [Paenibacillus eucommiae]|uniref:Regulatory protein YycH of two-component signal transduction system YycFG n=1 Tax=Paenibacillus eucommiae TaxID=1355755 RepID=A0ABS4J5U4_9BACL|nr:two-component system activity regulator YycH [Paenibacillus eucommiae]MBP1994636.1 regulatory protein YycH of two-component signal transduction system YycFG [Paenibacillus eucommiae]
MMDKLKTLVLVLLILGSLYQSYLLAYSSPKPESVQQNDYVQTELLGAPAELAGLLFPDQIIVHMGEDQHSVLYPGSYGFESLLDNITKRSIEGFAKTSIFLSTINWDEIRTKEQGVEIRFRDGLPITVLQKLLQIKGDLPLDNDIITRIWIFTNGEIEDVRTFLFTDSPSVSYEITKADFTSKDLEKFVSNYGNPLDLYKTSNGEYYLPVKPLAVTGYSFKYNQFTAEQLKRSLFVDPGITRNLKERNGSEIYTDAKRGLQINNEQRWFNYSDPVAPVDSKNDVSENLLAGVQFVNQHGGWDGNYAVVRTPQRQAFSNQTFIFRQYYDAFPIVNSRTDEGFGIIKLLIQKGIVSGYERSMVLPDEKTAVRTPLELPGAEALEARLKNYQRSSSIVSIYPAYTPIIKEDSVVLSPVWALEFRDGTLDFIQ